MKAATLKQLYEALEQAIAAGDLGAVEVYSRAVQRLGSIQ